MCVISFFYAVIVQMDHGSLSFDKVKIIFGILQIINIILRMIMTYVLIEKEEYRMKIYKSRWIHFQILQRLHIKGKSMKRQMAVEME